MVFTFGEASTLHGKEVNRTPDSISYTPQSGGLESYTFIYEERPLNCKSRLVVKLKLGDFVTYRSLGKPQGIFPITEIIVPEKPVVARGKRMSVPKSPIVKRIRFYDNNVSLVLDIKGDNVTVSAAELSFALPGPITEPDLYEGAEKWISEAEEIGYQHVSLWYKDLNVKVLLSTRKGEDTFRKNYKELVAYELFTFDPHRR